MNRVKRFIYRDSDVSSALIAILMGLLVGLIILLVSSPGQALFGFVSILTGGFSSPKAFGSVLYLATPIIMTGLSVGFANKTGLFNIGAPGQFIVGAYAAVLIGNYCAFLPGPTLWIAALIGAVIAGAVWGALPGLLKAYRNVNEVISCIMMNYIGMYMVNYLIRLTVFDSLKNQSRRVASAANLPKLGLDQLFAGSSANSGILIAILAGIAIYIILEKTKFGYELKAVGYNRFASMYAGVNEKRAILYSMLIAGALSGLGGALLYLAGSGKGIDVVDVLATEGFNGIPVALLGLSNPIGIIFSGLFIAYLTQGGFDMQLYNFAPQVIQIIIAVIIYFSALALLVKEVLLYFRKRSELKSGLKPGGGNTRAGGDAS